MYRGVMFNDTEDWFNFEGKLLVISKLTWEIWQVFTGWKILISFEKAKWKELNQNKISKQQDLQDAVWKLYLTLEINE